MFAASVSTKMPKSGWRLRFLFDIGGCRGRTGDIPAFCSILAWARVYGFAIEVSIVLGRTALLRRTGMSRASLKQMEGADIYGQNGVALEGQRKQS